MRFSGTTETKYFLKDQSLKESKEAEKEVMTLELNFNYTNLYVALSSPYHKLLFLEMKKNSILI